MATAATECNQYTLTGFGEFLEWRTLRFVEPMPRIRVCRLCGVVSSVARLLPCTHVLCESCEAQVVDKGRPHCPLDGAAFEKEDVQTMQFTKRELGERLVRCINDDGTDGSDGCAFTGKLVVLEEHFLAHCAHGRVRCTKCGGCVFRKDIVEHYLGCEGAETATSPVELVNGGQVILDAAEAGRLAETLKDIQQGLRDADLGTPRAAASIASLKLKAASLGDFLGVLDPHSSQNDVSRRGSLYESEAGPSTIIKFDGIDAMRKSEDPMLSLKDPCRLCGYTFILACKFEKSRGKLSSVSFLFTLVPGSRDDFVEWPFSKRVKLSIVHPTRIGKDFPVELKICQEKNARSLNRPQSNVPYNGILSEKVSWKFVEKKELVSDDCLLVSVEFE